MPFFDAAPPSIFSKSGPNNLFLHFFRARDAHVETHRSSKLNFCALLALFSHILTLLWRVHISNAFLCIKSILKYRYSQVNILTLLWRVKYSHKNICITSGEICKKCIILIFLCYYIVMQPHTYFLDTKSNIS